MTTYNIGQFATKALLAGKNAEDTLALVKECFPGCKTTIKCIYYYASKAKMSLRKSAAVNEEAMLRALASLGDEEAEAAYAIAMEAQQKAHKARKRIRVKKAS